jgi:predicted peroxiredoxin
MMKPKMAAVLLFVSICGLLASGCASLCPCNEQAAPVTDGVLVHISHAADDPHRALMGLRMAQVMSGNRDVMVYCDIKAIALVTQDGPDLQSKAFPSSKALLAQLIADDIPVYACPSCMKAADKTAADLVKGVKVANPDAFFDFTGGRIVTLDY